MQYARESVRPAAVVTPIDWSNPRAKISKYFSVWEVTQWDDRRIPATGSTEEAQILLIAHELDRIREDWGGPIGVTSWFRPPRVNREVGGAPYSQHLTGGAVDIYTMDGRDSEFESFLDANWGGGLGYGVASGLGFTHLDLRGGGWKYGDGAIRWEY